MLNVLLFSIATELSLPSTWTKPLDVYGEVTIGAGTPEYTAVETAFMSTLGAGGNSIIEVIMFFQSYYVTATPQYSQIEIHSCCSLSQLLVFLYYSKHIITLSGEIS